MKMLSNISALILFAVAINALAAGYSFMSDPSGGGLHIDISRLKHSPFNDYFLPGIVLFIVNGIFNCIAVSVILLRWKFYPIVIIFQGCILLGWIVIQVRLLRELNSLHLAFAGIALVLILLGLRIRHLKKVNL